MWGFGWFILLKIRSCAPLLSVGDVISRLSRELELSSKTTHNQA
jgi:hypothetical protein